MVDIDARQRLKLLAGAASAALWGCSGGGGGSDMGPVTPSPTPPTPTGFQPSDGLLRNTFRNNFTVGAAVQTSQVSNNSAISDIVTSQFNTIVSEFEMQPNIIAPTEGMFDFSAGDELVQYAEDNGLEIHGHSLLWHEITPDYFFEGTRDEIKARLQNYVTTVVSHFRGKISVWYALNEVVDSTGVGTTLPYRNSNWYQAAGGPEYIDWVLEAARAADPDAKLYINEYTTELPNKRARLIQVVEDLVARDIPLDGVGHQCHLILQDTAQSVLDAIDAVDGLFAGLSNRITELDVSVYSDPGSCWENGTNCDADYGSNIPESVLDSQAQLLRELFNGLILKSSLDSVTFWGVSDRDSWLNTSPVTRSNYPLLYDRNLNVKTGFRAITDRNFVI